MSTVASHSPSNGTATPRQADPQADAGQATVTECVVFVREVNEEIRKRRSAIRQSEDRQTQIARIVPSADATTNNGDATHKSRLTNPESKVPQPNDSQRLATCPDKISKELVGLSLSGGGVRSASFSIGLLQALGSSGFMKYVDYMSTVSGGGYTGALFSSLALKSSDISIDQLWHRLHPFARDGECNYDHEMCPLDAECSLRQQANDQDKHGKVDVCRRKPKEPTPNRDSHQQNKVIQRLAYGGDYLFRSKAEFATKYIVGFALNNLVLLSGLICVCALIAWSWRWLDNMTFIYHVIRPIDRYFDGAWWKFWQFEDDNVRPILPLFVLVPIWLISWPLVHLWSYRWASFLGRVMFAAVIASTLIGIAMVLGYRDTTRSTSFWNWQYSIYPWLGMAGGLLPFVRPKLLMQSAVHPKNQMQSYAFVIASTILLVGVPVFGVFWFGREDFAGSSDGRTALTNRDIIVPERLNKLVNTKPDNSGIVLHLPDWLKKPFNFLGINFSHTPDVSQLAKATVQGGIPGTWRIDPAVLKAHGLSDDESQRRAAHLGSIAEAMETKVRTAIADAYPQKEPPPNREQAAKRGKLLPEEIKDVELQQITHALSAALIGTSDPTPPPNVLPTIVGKNADLEDFIDAARERAPAQFSSEWQQADATEREKYRRYYEEHFLRFEEPRLRELLSRYERYGTAPGQAGAKVYFGSPVEESDLKELNRLILNAWYPAYFRTRAFIATAAVFEPDQRQRMYWCIGAALICFVSSILVNPNATSIQGYYRDRLNDTFVEDNDKDRREIRMAHLNTCGRGAPYHLLSGSATLKTLRNAVGIKDPAAAQELEIFLFSKLYSGSRTLRYAPTGRCLPNGYDTLGNAMAVSGAAIAPDAVNNLLLRSVMTVLNLRQGEWLPNPSESKNTLVDGEYTYWRPNYFWLLLGLMQPAHKQRLCFVTDGGHRENLGLAQLLLRRCRLIICSDAGCDPAHKFESLAKVLRICDLHLGIRFEEIKYVPPNETPLEYGTDLQSEPLDLYTVKQTVSETPKKKGTKKKRLSEGERCEPMLVDRHFILARIIYPELNMPNGLLVYLKPSLTGDESEAIENYRAQNEEFPHESTSDQDYDTAQFMSYVMLGRHIGDQVANLFSPHKAGVEPAKKNWWQTQAVAVECLVKPYLDRKTDSDESPSESGHRDDSRKESSQNGAITPAIAAKRVELIKRIQDESIEFEKRAGSIDKFFESEAARSDDLRTVSQLPMEFDPVLQNIARKATCGGTLDHDYVKLLKHFGPWGLVSIGRFLRNSVPNQALVELFASLALAVEITPAWRPLLEQEFKRLKQASQNWPEKTRRLLQDKMRQDLAKSLDKVTVIKSVTDE